MAAFFFSRSNELFIHAEANKPKLDSHVLLHLHLLLASGDRGRRHCFFKISSDEVVSILFHLFVFNQKPQQNFCVNQCSDFPNILQCIFLIWVLCI